MAAMKSARRTMAALAEARKATRERDSDGERTVSCKAMSSSVDADAERGDTDDVTDAEEARDVGSEFDDDDDGEIFDGERLDGENFEGENFDDGEESFVADER